jgi:hypothetical protein
VTSEHAVRREVLRDAEMLERVIEPSLLLEEAVCEP